MVYNYNHKDFSNVVSFLKVNNVDFYITENNQRILIKDSNTFRKILKSSKSPLLIKVDNEIYGIILVWKSFGNNILRHYIKLCCVDDKTADKLLTVLLWTLNIELFVKLKKDSSLIRIFKNKGFEFRGNRGYKGEEILLVYNKIRPRQNINDNNRQDS
jgi:hypothetical protein